MEACDVARDRDLEQGSLEDAFRDGTPVSSYLERAGGEPDDAPWPTVAPEPDPLDEIYFETMYELMREEQDV